MKKKTNYLYAILLLLVVQSSVFALETKSSDYDVVPDNAVNVNNILDLVDKTSIVPLNKENTEFVYTYNGKKGYINKDTNFGFITEYDNILPLANYLLVKQNNKFGLISKNGEVILKPDFQKINLESSNGINYFEAKQNGKYKMFYNDGKSMSLDDVFTLSQNTTILLANDLRPEFREVIEENVKLELKDIIKDTRDAKSVVDSYEIAEIPVPGRVKVAQVEKKVENADETNDVKVSNEKTENYIQPENVSSDSEFTINNKTFYSFIQNDKVGIKNEKQDVIVPAKYNSYKVVNGNLILVERNKAYSVYNTKGKLLAEQVYDKVNIYDKGSVYNFKIVDNVGYISKNRKELGTLVKQNGEYVYNKTSFSLFTNNVVRLVTTILDASN